jgi:hypothetical protein
MCVCVCVVCVSVWVGVCVCERERESVCVWGGCRISAEHILGSLTDAWVYRRAKGGKR